MPGGGTTSYTYDALNRATVVTEPMGQTSITTYDGVGNTLSHTNANGAVTSFTYSAANKIIAAANALGHTTEYSYDENGNLTAVTDANGNITTYNYDALNRVIAETDPLNNTIQHQYDALGNLILKTKPDGNQIVYSYDVNNQLTQILYPDETAVSYTYDAAGNRTSMADSEGSTAYTYDILGRLLSTTSNEEDTVGYQYDKNGNVIKITYPDGTEINYAYDEMNRQTEITEGENTTFITYDERGNRIMEELPNGTIVIYTYDGNDRLIEVSHNLEDEVISLTAYTLDNLGNRLTKTDEEGRITYYSYDELSQLTAVLYPDETGALYTYDPVGNRLTENDVTYSYDAANQLTQVGEAIYTYDANGNLLSDGEKVYQYDYENRLVVLTNGEATTTYTYDGDGNRLSQSIQDSEEARTHEYIYDINKGLPELIVEIEGENEYIYIYAGRVISQVSEEGTAYYHHDGLGSIVLITDEDGETLNRYEYDAFGTPDKLLETIHNPFLFTGEPYDENGLIFLRARYYDPATGRFLTRDTYLVNDPLSQHLYIYVGNNPVLYVDPSGHLKKCSNASGPVIVKSIPGSKYYHDIVRDYVAMHLGIVYENVQTEVEIPKAGASGIRAGYADIVADNRLVWEIKTVKQSRKSATKQLARYTSKLAKGEPGDPVVPFLTSNTIETPEEK